MIRTSSALWAVALCAGIAGAETIEERVKALEDRMQVGGTAAPEAGTAPPDPKVIDLFFKNGLQAKSRDGNFEIKIGGRVIVHYREYFANPEPVSISGFTFREVKLDFKGKILKDWGFRVETVSTGPNFSLHEGWVSFERWSFLKAKVGQYKAPYSIEQTTSTLFLDMPERPATDRLVPGYELGVMIYGEPVEKILEYNVMVGNGTGTLGSDLNSDKDLFARLQLRPFAKMDNAFIKGLHLALSGNMGKRGLATGVLPYNYSSPSTGTAFVAKGPRGNEVRFDEDRYRFEAELAWLAGPVGVKAEYHKTRDTYRFPGQTNSTGGGAAHTNHVAFFVTASWFVTGEEKGWDRPVVKRPLFGADGGFGAVEVVGRYARFNVPGDLFSDGILSRDNSAQHVDEIAACINWYPNANVRLSVMYSYVEYNGHSTRPVSVNGRRFDHEDVLIVRAQIDF